MVPQLHVEDDGDGDGDEEVLGTHTRCPSMNDWLWAAINAAWSTTGARFFMPERAAFDRSNPGPPTTPRVEAATRSFPSQPLRTDRPPRRSPHVSIYLHGDAVLNSL